jgi:hypothetical protein
MRVPMPAAHACEADEELGGLFRMVADLAVVVGDVGFDYAEAERANGSAVPADGTGAFGRVFLQQLVRKAGSGEHDGIEERGGSGLGNAGVAEQSGEVVECGEAGGFAGLAH